MRSTLFYIPHEWNGLPVVGLGWLLIAWLILSAGIIGWLIRKQGWNQETASYLPFLGVVALVIVFFLPNMMELAPVPGQPGKFIPVGIPIRGFGVMMMVAMVAGVGLAMHRARQMGIDPEVMTSLAMWMIFPGIIGARLFFIVQYHTEFRTLMSLLDVTKGGLVVYGSVLTGVPCGIFYLIRRGLPVLAMLDIIAPSMVVGAALGRIGCFLNGCCYGGECTWPVAMTFPPRAAWYLKDSPPYQRHHELGLLYGMELRETDQRRAKVERVDRGTAAERAGVKQGDILTHISGQRVDNYEDALASLGESGKSLELTTSTGEVRRIMQGDWPGRSLPIHPTQLYAALDAGLLALVLWLLYPFRRRDGEIFALLITVHPLCRFLLEMIRSDESGQFGTRLTISQWISLGFLVLAGGFWFYVVQQPRGSALPRMTKSE
ncbi:MAG: prolipoprotein diacylglyceryl transferase [Pirellulaceae bacterium]|nr:prolipoprotein diacylglyceryl transferase [Pirellulaceae bacterium]